MLPVCAATLLLIAAACGNTQPSAQASPKSPTSPGGTPWTRCSRVAIAADAAAQVTAGQSVVFTATAYGCAPADYRFILVQSGSGDWMVTQGWDPSPTWTWDTSRATPGPYSIVADARPRDEPGDSPDASISMPLAVVANVPGCTSISLSASQQSPVSSGAKVAFTANAIGCMAGEFRFQLFDLATGAGIVMRDWGPANAWTWDTSNIAVGRYAIQVDVRLFGTTRTDPDASGRIEIDIVHGSQSGASNCTNVAIHLSATNPVTAGAPVTTTATVSGCASAEYRFQLVDLSTGVGLVMQDWSSSNTWTWDTTGAQSGRYAVQVDVRATGVASLNPDASARLEVDIVH